MKTSEKNVPSYVSNPHQWSVSKADVFDENALKKVDSFEGNERALFVVALALKFIDSFVD